MRNQNRTSQPKVHKELFQRLFAPADIQIDGNRPWDIKVHNDAFYSRVISQRNLGLGESYMDGWWDCDSVDQLIEKVLQVDLGSSFTLKDLPSYLRALLTDHGSRMRSSNIAEKHYDIGNDLFSVMLDKRLVYTCAYWDKAADLDSAQEAKLDLVCRKLGLKAGQSVLDIGCGWGSFAKFAAEKYGVRVVGVTVSKEQVELGNKLCAGLPVEICLMDYRDVNEKFDHIVSLGMFEHVGAKHFRTYMKKAAECLKDDGLFLLHTIGSNDSYGRTDKFLDKYIFPGGRLPLIEEIGKSIENIFIMEDWHNFGSDYGKTLMAWYENFDKNWPQLREKYGERFYRMWKYYLLSCAGAFRSRKVPLWQIVLSKKGVQGGYKSVR